MAEPNPQIHDDSNPFDASAAQASQDYAAVLIKVIEDVSNDPVALRRLVYALAWHNLKPEALASAPVIPEQPKSILELERVLELNRVIKQVEAYIARNPLKRGPEAAPAPHLDEAKSAPLRPTVDDGIAAAERWYSSPLDLDDVARVNRPQPEATPNGETAPTEEPRQPDPDGTQPTPSSNAVIMSPEQPPTWLYRLDPGVPNHGPDWIDHRIRLALETMEYNSTRRRQGYRPEVVSFAQLVGAVIFGVALFVGITGWIQIGRQHAYPPPAVAIAPAPPPRSIIAPPTRSPEFQFNPQLLPLRPPVEPKPALPFPLPKAFGVYAVNQGELVELEPLPIKVPDPRILVSAEISKPSRFTVSGDKLSFVIFRRDLLSNAPPTVPIRVVARVQRTMKFVNGKPTTAAVEGTWRIRAKSYEFKVLPIEGQREMVMVQPDRDFALPAGRYALVLAGYGYDFSVTGKVTAAEQCLEQVEVLNGNVLSECPKA